MNWLHVSIYRSTSANERGEDQDGRALLVRIGALMLTFAVEWRR